MSLTIPPTGTLIWTLRDQPSRRTPTLYTTDCYLDRIADQWIVIVVCGPETVASEVWDSEERAAHRAMELHEALKEHGWISPQVS